MMILDLDHVLATEPPKRKRSFLHSPVEAERNAAIEALDRIIAARPLRPPPLCVESSGSTAAQRDALAAKARGEGRVVELRIAA
jgi:hypothetical protein